jgi:DNA invertase Pin-like site-specific DNA recombinase
MVSLDEDRKENPMVKLLLQMMSIGAEQENRLRHERQMQGIQLAKMQGKYSGREKGATQSKEKTLTKYQDVADLIKSSNLSIRKIAKITKRSINTVRKVKGLIGT